MKLRAKFTLLNSALVILILLCVDLVVYLLFIQLATRNEIDQLRNKSEQIIEKIGPRALMDSSHSNQVISYLPEDSTIRILTPDFKPVQTFQEEQDFDVTRIRLSAGRDSQLLHIDDQKILVVRVPIQADNEVIGLFEIAESMESLEANMNLLVMILLFSTAGAVLLILIGASFLSKTLLKPISDSIATMREIESSLAFKKIPSSGRSNDELYQMTETFNRMMVRLEENFLLQQQFVSDASHELNTTLTIVEGYANMLRRWGTTDQSIQKESIEAIYEESKHMRKMTRQLLDLASSQKHGSLLLEPFDLVAICRQTCSLAKQLHAQRIDIHANPNEIKLVADITKIKQLMLILIDNALKYSDRAIEVHLSSDSTHALLRVKDYGVGIAPDQIEQVFERFYRVDSSRNRKTGGSGLGLPIARSIVNEHRGSIHLESKEDVGTEVFVKLPLGLLPK
ncbi:HAMP domain-containing sensor histidine kinase [Cohnella yongneupensis]|uniref:Signal transduction histidine-protein kinase ArlS n=1 Tax=Cohnella yongneupensis TaxID=425006 RepID=A0ABW0R1K5_9BACL